MKCWDLRYNDTGKHVNKGNLSRLENEDTESLRLRKKGQSTAFRTLKALLHYNGIDRKDLIKDAETQVQYSRIVGSRGRPRKEIVPKIDGRRYRIKNSDKVIHLIEVVC